MAPTTKTKRSGGSSKSTKKTTSKKSGSTKASTKTGKSKITNYPSALKWLFEHIDHEKQRVVKYTDDSFNLNRMQALLKELGNPHEQVKVVHVAGTKGKGSTCHMVSSMLEHCGLTVGLYTSPHLIDLRERVTINGQMINHADAVDLFKQIAAAETSLKDDGPFTFFEILTGLAFKYFADQAVDIAVLETGLGGRLDCTNVCEPVVTAITQISMDHTNILGNELTAIASEKAGIFKSGVRALTIAQDNDVMSVLKESAEAAGTKLEVNGKDIDFSYRFESNRELGPHTRVCLTTENSRFEHLAVPLKGEHQALNCGLALAIIDGLKTNGYDLPDDKIIDGLAETKIDGRMEQVWQQPRVYIDGAHNCASITALTKALGAHISYDSCVTIFGCAQDKDVEGLLQQIALGADKVIFTKAKGNPRACEPKDLQKMFAEISPKMAQVADNIGEAVKLAARAVSREDIILITGSFYMAGEARKHFIDLTNQRSKK